MIDAREAAKEGRRVHAFYLGYQAHARGDASNPFPAGSERARCWENGWKYAAAEAGDAIA